jgi:dolichyl-phosphate beta-glucosyltransferase
MMQNASVSGDSPAGPLPVSVIVPAFNEQRGIETALRLISSAADERGQRWEIIVVDDGSRDRTAEIADAFDGGGATVRLLRLPENRGKGAAVRRGMLEATGDALLMCDADMSTPIAQIDLLLPWMERGYDVVIGSRDMPDSRLDPPQTLARRWLAGLFRAMRRRRLLGDLRDTQCGFKLFRREAAQRIFPHQTVDGWVFDCEVLAIAERLGYRIREVGVEWHNDSDSRVRPVRDALHTWRELRRVCRRMRDFDADRPATPH